jgi:hypothetical protein
LDIIGEFNLEGLRMVSQDSTQSNRVDEVPSESKTVLRRWDLAAVLVLAVFNSIYPFLAGSNFLAGYTDDFYYGLVVARNLALHGVSTFDGVHLTNGYHPLWVLTLAALYRVLPGKSVFFGVELVTIIAVLAAFVIAKYCLSIAGASERVARFLAMVFILQTLILTRAGMEINIAIPLLLGVVAFRLSPGFRRTTRQTILFGFLSSLTNLKKEGRCYLAVEPKLGPGLSEIARNDLRGTGCELH